MNGLVDGRLDLARRLAGFAVLLNHGVHATERVPKHVWGRIHAEIRQPAAEHIGLKYCTLLPLLLLLLLLLLLSLLLPLLLLLLLLLLLHRGRLLGRRVGGLGRAEIGQFVASPTDRVRSWRELAAAAAATATEIRGRGQPLSNVRPRHWRGLWLVSRGFRAGGRCRGWRWVAGRTGQLIVSQCLRQRPGSLLWWRNR